MRGRYRIVFVEIGQMRSAGTIQKKKPNFSKLNRDFDLIEFLVFVNK